PDDQARSASDRADHDWRCGEVAKVRCANVRERRLRDWLLLSCSATWYRAYPNASLRCAFTQRLGIRRKGLRRSERRTDKIVLPFCHPERSAAKSKDLSKNRGLPAFAKGYGGQAAAVIDTLGSTRASRKAQSGSDCSVPSPKT